MVKTLKDAKELRARWDACTNDTERVLLAKETGNIKFTLDNDNTTAGIQFDYQQAPVGEVDEIDEVCYLKSLDADFGNREGVETLLNVLGIPFEHC